MKKCSCASRGVRLQGLVLLTLMAIAAPAAAYVGPGAGFALISSLGVVFVTLLLALVALLTWPFRLLWRLARRKRRGKPKIKRLVIVGYFTTETGASQTGYRITPGTFQGCVVPGGAR